VRPPAPLRARANEERCVVGATDVSTFLDAGGAALTGSFNSSPGSHPSVAASLAIFRTTGGLIGARQGSAQPMRSQAFELAGSQLKISNVQIIYRRRNPGEQAVAIGKGRWLAFG
jgi:hypothetical protein